MIAVISPAKSLDYETSCPIDVASTPEFMEEAAVLVKKLETLSASELSSLMKISPKLGELNFNRYQDWNIKPNESQVKQALFAFTGDVYMGLEPATLTTDQVLFAQEQLRILSGLYGILKPMDLIQAYRLEMGTKLLVRGKKNLYEFWGDTQTKYLIKALENHDEKVLINLASTEYFKSVKPKQLGVEVITPEFKDFKNGEYKVISFFAKKARGMMCRFIIDKKLRKAEGLKGFDYEGYGYNVKLSTDTKWVFTRG